MKILITGGAGFIGCHLVNRLINMDCDITVIDNFSTGRKLNIEHMLKKIRLIETDMSKTGSWQNEISKFDRIFHLAALADIVPSIQNPYNYFRANVTATLNLLEAISNKSKTKIVYTASSSCYGLPKIFPTPETAEIKPEYPYALTKRIAEEILLHWAGLYKLNVISLRLFNVYGPKSRTSGTYGAVFGVFLKQKLAGHPYTVVGDGCQTRDFTYVSDVVEALICAMDSEVRMGVYNVGSGETIAINKIVELLGGEKVFIEKRPGEPDCTFASISKIRKELRWEPSIKIDHGIKKILADIKYWEDAPLWTPEKIKSVTKDWFKYIGGKNDK